MTDALTVTNLTKTFGGLRAVNDVTLAVAPGERRAIIGPNGAGKTTLFNLIAGQLHADAGDIMLYGTSLTGLAVHQRARQGVSRTFQLSTLFGELKVRDQVALAVIGNDPKRRTRLMRGWETDPHVRDTVDTLMHSWGLSDVAHTPAHTLGYGTRRLLELVLATAHPPKVLLLDEPTAGVDQTDRQRIVDTIASLSRNITVLLVEHDMTVAFNLADTVTVLTDGTELLTGPPQTVASDSRVIDAYLGRQER